MVIGPIDKRTWNVLSTYRSSLKYHKGLGNEKVVSMVEPMYNHLMKSIKKEAA